MKIVLKQIKFAGILLLLMGVSTGVTSANPSLGMADVKATQQSGTCTGIVKDAIGETVIGASVVVKGTTNGTITGLDGDFSLKDVKKGDVVIISFVGYQAVEVVWDGNPINVTLEDDTQKLQEVVVTALGIKREKKALGYAMQEVKGESLLAARETNLANALTGKVSGVQVIRSSNGPGGSSKIQLRGANSVTGLNQPLIVVDGVPMDNFTGAANNDIDNPTLDMGNGLSDINAEDIESMSVLKGASAAALYGSRAGNGVILITTKKGTKKKGLGVTVSASVSAETTFMLPKRQSIFGQGENGVYSSTNDYSWGPAVTGQSYDKWDGTTGNMQVYDNVNNYFNTGSNFTESISLAQQYDKTSIYASVNRMDDASMIPGAKLNRTNLTLRATSTFGKDDRWSFDAKIQYINTEAQNRPINGARGNNAFYTVFNLPTTIDIRDFSDPVRNTETGEMVWWNKGGQNPYWMKDYNPNKDSRNRFLMNGSLKYKITDWLDAEIRAGSDMYFTETDDKLYTGSPLNEKYSRYSVGETKFYENNFSFLISGRKDALLGKFGGNFSFGGNLMERKSSGLESSMGRLIAPNLFSLNNGDKKNLTVTEPFSHKKINSLYGTLGVNYDGWAFLDATFRNDWSSALEKKNRSFFYPSLSLSWVISDMVNKLDKQMPEWFTFAKARVSFAQVGNDMDAYQLYNTYTISSDANGNTIAGQGKTKYDSNVRSELITSWEAGAELKFFNNRLGVDFAWYKTNAKRQLMNIPLNNLSGFDNMKVNAGNIQNTGIEIMLNARPVETSQFSWDAQVNFSKNSSKIIELLPGKPGMRYGLGGSDALQVYAVAGGSYGEIWGTKYQRVEEGEHKGQLLLNDAGLPQATSEKHKIGDQQPDFLLGWTNTFSYKNFTLSFLIDGRFGGDIFSFTNLNLQRSGISDKTAPGGKREDFIVSGVISNGNGGYKVNDLEVSQEKYYKALATGRAGISEAYLYDATNIRLRNISLNYSFPSSMLKNTVFQQIKLGVSINNVWMITSHMNGIDPESVYATSTNASGLENSSAPTSRSYLFNVTFAL